MNPTSEDDLDLTLIARYLSGECTPVEVDHVRKWAEAAPGRTTQLEEARIAWKGASAEALPVAEDAIWNRIAGRVRSDAEASRAETATSGAPSSGRSTARARVFSKHLAHASRSNPGRSVWRRAGKIAAVVVAAAGVSWWTYHRHDVQPDIPYREVVTRPGERAQVDLGDGSRITLGFASRVRYPEDMKAGPRSVELTGEAHFAVARDTARPFVVRTGRSRTRVLGTEFLVRSLPEGDQDRVIVASGSVLVSGIGDSATAATLARGDLLLIAANGSANVTHGVDVERYLRRMAGALDWEGTPLREAMVDLERKFDIEVNVEPGMLDRRLTALFEREPVDEVLATIAEIVGARQTREERSVLLTPDSSKRDPGKRFRKLRTDTGAIRIGR
jgi:transmembrane sensor